MCCSLSGQEASLATMASAETGRSGGLPAVTCREQPQRSLDPHACQRRASALARHHFVRIEPDPRWGGRSDSPTTDPGRGRAAQMLCHDLERRATDPGARVAGCAMAPSLRPLSALRREVSQKILGCPAYSDACCLTAADKPNWHRRIVGRDHLGVEACLDCGRRLNTGPPAPVENWPTWRGGGVVRPGP